MRKQYILSLLTFLGFFTTILSARDNAHFYRATLFPGEPRFEKQWLTSIDTYILGGSTTKSRDACKRTVPLLDLYGTHNMRLLGKGVPNKDLTNPIDINLTQLALLPSRKNFGRFSFSGKFEILEGGATLTQNLVHGLFLEAHVPFRRLEIDGIKYCDLSPTDSITPNINEIEWQTFLNQFDAMLKRYQLDISGFEKTGVGDVSAMIGWTVNHQDTEILDFVDATIKAGFLFATAEEKDENKVFDIPLGYNGHNGIPMSFDLSIGAYEWLTAGGHIDAIIFFDNSKVIRLKTDPLQSGMIKLARGCAKIEKGTLWNIGAYLKADHIVRGLSIWGGYTFTNKNDDKISPDTCCKCTPTIANITGCTFNQEAVNSDEMYKGWKMHTIHFAADYDFTGENSRIGPRLGIFYDYQVSGKRVFKTNVGGGLFGLDISWVFD